MYLIPVILFGSLYPQTVSEPVVLAEISAEVVSRDRGIDSLSVSMSVTARLPEAVRPELANQALDIIYLTDEKQEFAFKRPDKRYGVRHRPEQYRRLIAADGTSSNGSTPPSDVVNTIGVTVNAYNGKRFIKAADKVISETADPRTLARDGGYFNQQYLYCTMMQQPDVFDASATRVNTNLAKSLDSGSLSLVRTEELEGYLCHVLQRGDAHTIWIARQLGWAVVRQEYRTSSGILSHVVMNSDFREYSEDLFLPMTCIWQRHATKNVPAQTLGTPIVEYHIHVDSLSINDVPDSLFEVQLPSGKIAAVRDLDASGQVTIAAVRVPASPNQLDDAIARTRARKSGPTGERSLPVIWAFNIAIIVAVVFFVVLRVRRRK